VIKQAVFEDEIINGMMQELQLQNVKVASKKEGVDNLVKAADLLQAAMEIFEETGLTAQADQVLNILSKIAHQKVDHHTQGLTPEKMVKNLKEHGIVFNLADDGQADHLLNADIEMPLENSKKPINPLLPNQPVPALKDTADLTVQDVAHAEDLEVGEEDFEDEK
jgi:hypothetical protein